MAQAARILDRQDSLEDTAQFKRKDLKVVLGEGSPERKMSPFVYGLIRTALMVFFVAVIIGMVRVALITLTTSTLVENQTLEASIAEIETSSVDLLVQHSVYANPARVKEVATGSLGMVAPAAVVQIEIDGVEVAEGHSGDQIVATADSSLAGN